MLSLPSVKAIAAADLHCSAPLVALCKALSREHDLYSERFKPKGRQRNKLKFK